MRFFYGARTRADLFYLDELAAIAAKLDGFQVHPALSHAAEARTWDGETGFVHEVVLRAFARGKAGRRDRRLRLRADADDRRGAAGSADERRRARAHLFRQVYAGDAMTALQSSSHEEHINREDTYERTTRADTGREAGSREVRSRRFRDISGLRQPQVQLFEPKGRKATHYEDMTVDVQPDPERYLLQDWIISFPDGTPTYSKDWTAAKSSNWHKFRAVDQEWERTHYQRQSTICGMVQNTIENGRKSGAPSALRPGLGENPAESSRRLQACRIRSRHLDHAGAALRLHPDGQQRDPDQLLLQAALRAGHHALSERDRPRPSRASTLPPASSIGSRIRSGRATRKSIESIMGSNDYLEQYFATNVVFEPLVGELFRSGFIMQAAAAQNDFITPAVVSAAEADYERNLANTVELFHMLGADPAHGAHNIALFNKLAGKARRSGARGRQPSAADLVAAARQGRDVQRCAGAREEPHPRASPASLA